MRVFSGSSNPVLAERIANYLSLPLGEIDVNRFPDGETFVKIKENIRGRDVFVVQSICRQPNEHLMELLIMIDAMRRASADRITAVLPYYGYARQDRKDQPRVPITAKLVANLLVAAGANRLLTIDLHAQQIQGFFDIPVDHLYAFPIFAKYLQDKDIENPVIVAPDMGGVKAAHAYAQMFDSGLAVIAKRRTNAEHVEAFTLVGDVEGRKVIMVDDLVSTCGTLCAAARLLTERGASEIYAAVSHAIMGEIALRRLETAPIRELIITDTIPQPFDTRAHPITVLTIAELLGDAMIRIHENRSVTSLFRL